MTESNAPRRSRRVLYIVLVFAAVLVVLGLSRKGELVIETAPPGEGYREIGTFPLEFSAMAYNVQARPMFDDTGYKFEGISPLMNPFDIVGFQECFKDHEALWEGTTHPVRVYDGTLRDWYRIVGSGLSTISRFPMKEALHEHFVLSGDNQNKPASKGILLVRNDLGGGVTLDFYNTHLTAGKQEPNIIARPAQVRQLIDYVKRNSPPEHLVIFAGDFNLRSGGEDATLPETYPADLSGLNRGQLLAAICKELGLQNAGETLTGTVPDIVDHILYRSGTTHDLVPLTWKHDTETYFTADGKELSDHEPVIADFRVTEKAAAVVPAAE